MGVSVGMGVRGCVWRGTHGLAALLDISQVQHPRGQAAVGPVRLSRVRVRRVEVGRRSLCQLRAVVPLHLRAHAIVAHGYYESLHLCGITRRWAETCSGS